MTRRGAVQHGADRVNRLAVATDDAADVGLAQLHFEDRHLAVRNFRQHHVVRKFHELPNDELEEFLHFASEGGAGVSAGGSGGVSAGAAAGSISTGAGVGAGFTAAAAFFAAVAAAFFAAASGFLVFLII